MSKSFISSLASILSSPIEYLKGVGPQRGDLLKKEASIFTFQDLLEYFPFRHIDKTTIIPVSSISEENSDYVQVQGKLISKNIAGEKRGKRLLATLRDQSGEIELVWFQGITWIEKTLQPGEIYRAFGKASFFQHTLQMTHPELETISGEETGAKSFLDPIYPSTEKLKVRGLGGRQIAKLTANLLSMISQKDIPENLPEKIIVKYLLSSRYQAFNDIHFPSSVAAYDKAVRRLKFEELFISQLRMGLLRLKRYSASRGFVFKELGDYFNIFYQEHLPFALTNAQKKVIKEIRKDIGSGRQMNRLLQGDVGSGKTMVALCIMLIAAGNHFQSCFMAPTEILANQHYANLSKLLKDLPLSVKLLTGSTPLKEKNKIFAACESGEVHILVGTHAIIEDRVKFKNLGLAVVDEQHRFGVAQRAKLWSKNDLAPHILVMTATPIPRTLALTAYGDLDVSIIDELPPGRTPVLTVHRKEYARPQVMDFIKNEIGKGRQAYVIYPLIEESSTLDYENLMKGYEEVKAFFPEQKYNISMVHGRQKAAEKNRNMQGFVKGEAHLMVSTTVIEVGVDVPNASVMLIESAEKFGLPQLHQLRGRVGRGSEKSYCILSTKVNISREARLRIDIMCQTNDGFKIAETDLVIRGPGDIEGTRQSGLLNFKIANVLEDKAILEEARICAEELINTDPGFTDPQNNSLQNFLMMQRGKTKWSKIS
ncbi:ATP-dependent DNA helicase RecG [soil metagenome]